MKIQLLCLVIGLFFSLHSKANYQPEASNPDSINDGPYIFNLNTELKIKWIENNVLKEGYITPDNFTAVKKYFNLLFNYEDLPDTYLAKPDYNQSFNKIDSIVVITDIHGEYNIYLDLLKATGIIDKNLNWNFGKGHLVILGDSFDRGPMVTEVLWHIFGLEKQAAKAGGMVHVLLGNHGAMVLSKDLRYINEKYKRVEEIADTRYCDLYSETSVLGKWLRTKPVVITINNILFVHAGISIEMVRRDMNIVQINQVFSNKIIGKNKNSIKRKEELNFLYGNDGPLWYRGYFSDKSFCESRLDSILHFYGKEHIVVGHTVCDDIQSLYNNKIFGIDVGIMNELPGEVLIYKNGFFYKGDITGTRIKL